MSTQSGAIARPDLAVFIPTLNEAMNVHRAIESVLGWAAQVFVVDSLSSDDTVRIARSYEGVQVFEHPFENYSKQWNWALDNLPIETEWVMILAADESVPEKTRDEIAAAIQTARGEVAAFTLWWKFIFMGKWLKHTCRKVHSIRIWRTGRGRFEDRSVNEQLIVDGEVRSLKQPLIHDDRKGISAWVWRHNRYSTMEAIEFFRRKEKVTGAPSGRKVAWRRFLFERVWPWVPCGPLLLFLYRFFFRLGFLDGRAGLDYALLKLFFSLMISLKKREYRLTGAVSSQDAMM